MANTAHPGFFPTAFGTGGTITYIRRRALSNNTNAIALQDAVTADANGNILGTATSATLATAVDTVAMGTSYVDASSARVGGKTLPAATTYTGSTVDPVNASYVFCVENVTNVKFRCSCDTAITLTHLRNNTDINLAASVNGVSQQELRTAGFAAATATLPFRLLDFVFAADNDIDAAHAHVFATINAGFTEPALTLLVGT